MSEHKKYGWTAKGIVGMVFTPMGLIWLVLGVALWYYGAGDGPDDSLVFLCVFGGLGAIFLLVGLGLLLADIHRRTLLRRAYESGYYVMAKIAGTEVRANVNVKGRHPKYVECHYTDPSTGTVHVYFSRDLYVQVDDLFTSDEVPVYLDRMNDAVGFVDIDAVLPKIQVHT